MTQPALRRNAPDRFESDFMVQYLADAGYPHPLPEGEGVKTVSPEAVAVRDAGRTLWKAYFAHTDVPTGRDELKLNRPEVGWYQNSNAFKTRNTSGDTAPINFGHFAHAYQALTDRLRPQVFMLGFLR